MYPGCQLLPAERRIDTQLRDPAYAATLVLPTRREGVARELAACKTADEHAVRAGSKRLLAEAVG